MSEQSGGDVRGREADLEDRPKWLRKAVPVRDATFEAAFTIFRSFLAGEFAGNPPLFQPGFPLFGQNDYVGLAVTRDVKTSISALVRHYREVARLWGEHNVKTKFWVTSIIHHHDGGQIAYLDRPSVAIPALLSQKDGQLFFDGDQGYEVEVFARNDVMFLRDYDPDDEEEFNTISFSRTPLQSQVEETRERLRAIMGVLFAEFGESVWNW